MNDIKMIDYRGLGFPNYPEDDDIMIDCRRRKAEVSRELIEELNDPSLREKRLSQIKAEYRAQRP